MANEPSASFHEAILQAWECAFADTPVIYLSGPITTGLRQIERLRSNSPLTKADVVRENSTALREAAARLRRERREIVVEPASLNVVRWSQHDYLALWAEFIERHVKLIVFMPGWEFSVGSASEYLRALAHDVRTETISGSPIYVSDALALMHSAHDVLAAESGGHVAELSQIAQKLEEIISELDRLQKPRTSVARETHRKDESLNVLSERMNVAQFVSFSPSGKRPKQEYARIAGMPANSRFPDLGSAVEALLLASAEHSVNVRSYEPSSPQSHEFVYGITDPKEAVAAVERLTDQGLFTIINETIDVHDGGVSGVLMGDVVEFAPDDTPRCVEKPGTASLPRGWGRELLSTVYGFPVALDVPLASRLEFSIHPSPRGWLRSNILAWEFAPSVYVDAKAEPRWPNRFSRLVGDKAFGLLVAHSVGLPVPFSTVINRRIAPFSFGRTTRSGEKWIRTVPVEQVPGRFTTNRGWLDPFSLLKTEDPTDMAIVSVISQDGVRPQYSGALIVGASGHLVIEGKKGEGASLMIGTNGPDEIPEVVEAEVRSFISVQPLCSGRCDLSGYLMALALGLYSCTPEPPIPWART